MAVVEHISVGWSMLLYITFLPIPKKMLLENIQGLVDCIYGALAMVLCQQIVPFHASNGSEQSSKIGWPFPAAWHERNQNDPAMDKNDGAKTANDGGHEQQQQQQ